MAYKTQKKVHNLLTFIARTYRWCTLGQALIFHVFQYLLSRLSLCTHHTNTVKHAYVVTSIKGHLPLAAIFPGSLESKYSADEPELRGHLS